MVRATKPSNPVVEDDQEEAPTSPQPTPSATPAPMEANTPDLSNFGEMVKLIRNGKDEEIKVAIAAHLEKLASEHKLDNYLPLYLFDPETSLNSFHSNEIYDAASRGDRSKDILLVVQSSGGRIEPAYLISKTCKRLSNKKFVVVVPRRAKSAATLLALGADEIHMGLMSELGPIDPQIDGYPALGLTNALNKVAELSSKFPESAEMWSKYLGAKLDLNDLGYFDRVSESAAQYAERLMKGKSLPDGKTPSSLASHFVNHYKDHSFVIDSDECISLLGPDVIKTETPEYNFGNAVYSFLNLFDLLLSAFRKKEFAVIGSSSDINMRDKGSK